MAMILNNGICRCCSSEGTFKDVKSKYHWMGEEEVYADMINECFNISLYVEEFDDSGICELCITQLRNAVNFKKQVLHTEQQFLKAINEKTLEVIKIEKFKSDEEMEDLSDHFADGDDLGDPDFVPELKEEKAEEEPETNNRVGPTASKSKVNNPAEKKTTVKRERCLKDNSELRDLFEEESDEEAREKYKGKATEQVLKHLHNGKEIMTYTNATPIHRHVAVGYMCSFCNSVYQDPKSLKDHTLEAHDITRDWEKFKHEHYTQGYLLKLDITNLACKICNDKIDTLENLIFHLKAVHCKFFHDIKNQILPFKFDDNHLKCVVCLEIFNTFKTLLEHMSTHYNNFPCELCGAPHVNRRKYRFHKLGHKTGTFKCNKCDKVFDTANKKKYHEVKVHLRTLRNKCGYCSERFPEYEKKLQHLRNEHGVHNDRINCQYCGKGYRKKRELAEHIKRIHLMERTHSCQYCDKSFFKAYELRDHMARHSKEKSFQCDICSKYFASRKRLLRHIIIHSEDRRFKCMLCGYDSVYKKCWRQHMWCKHQELY